LVGSRGKSVFAVSHGFNDPDLDTSSRSRRPATPTTGSRALLT
jgi:hypothetical protein